MLSALSFVARNLEAWLERLSLWLAWSSGLVMTGLLLLTATDVGLRYLFNAPIYGLHEVTESALVFIVVMGIPYCTTTDGHVRMDLFDNLFGKRLQHGIQLLTGSISLIVLGLLAERSARKAVDAHVYDDTTNFLQMPLWPLYALIAFGISFYALVIFQKMLSALVGLFSSTEFVREEE